MKLFTAFYATTLVAVILANLAMCHIVEKRQAPEPAAAAESAAPVAPAAPATTRKPTELETTLKKEHEHNVHVFQEFVNKTREGKFNDALSGLFSRLNESIAKVLPVLAPRTAKALGVGSGLTNSTGIEAKSSAPAIPASGVNQQQMAEHLAALPGKINDFFADLFKQIVPDGKSLQDVFSQKSGTAKPGTPPQPAAPTGQVAPPPPPVEVTQPAAEKPSP